MHLFVFLKTNITILVLLKSKHLNVENSFGYLIIKVRKSLLPHESNELLVLICIVKLSLRGRGKGTMIMNGSLEDYGILQFNISEVKYF